MGDDTLGMSIGEVARQAELQPSAIRYYESLGLIPEPPRVGGKRRYDASVLEWLSLIALAREAGFTMKEIRQLVTGFTPGTRPAARWRELATRKLIQPLFGRQRRPISSSAKSLFMLLPHEPSHSGRRWPGTRQTRPRRPARPRG